MHLSTRPYGMLCALTHALPLYVCACISPPWSCPEDSASSPQWHSEQHHSGPCLLPSVTWSRHPHLCHVPLSQTAGRGTWSCPTFHHLQPYAGHSCQATRRHCWRHVSHRAKQTHLPINFNQKCVATSKRLTAHAKHSVSTWTGRWHVCGNASRLAAITQDWCNSLVTLGQKYGSSLVMSFQSHIMYHGCHHEPFKS